MQTKENQITNKCLGCYIIKIAGIRSWHYARTMPLDRKVHKDQFKLMGFSVGWPFLVESRQSGMETLHFKGDMKTLLYFYGK